MPLRAPHLILVLLVTACASMRPSPGAKDGLCSKEAKRFDGGQFLTLRDGVQLWFKVAGKKGAPALAYLHGGPGYNAYAFEQSGGKLLEQEFQVVYLDQRGCGRSGFDGAPEQYGMAATVEDLEQLRQHLGLEKLVPVGHSFGGLVAAEYARRHPDRTAAVVMVDTSPDTGRALAHQVAFIDSIADAKFPEHAADIHAHFAGPGAPFEKLGRMYELIGRLPLHRQLHYADPAVQVRMESLDDASGIMGCTVGGKVVPAFLQEGYLSGPLPTIARRLDAPTLLLGGTASQVIGRENLEYAARTWGARLEWIDAGHFVYFERPEAFARAVTGFLRTVYGSTPG